MTRRVAFLRAVNVGRRTVPMKLVAETCVGLGYDDVWTHANSGNVVVDASGPRAGVEHAIGAALERSLGFEVTTFVRSATELRGALQVDPFEVGAGDTYFVTFLKRPASAATATKLESASNDFDTLVVHGRDVHWLMHGKSTETKLTRATWNLVGEHASTSRNVTMLRKLAAKLAVRAPAGQPKFIAPGMPPSTTIV